MPGLGRAEMLVAGVLGYPPVNGGGARLLSRVIADAYERQSVILPEVRDSGMHNLVLRIGLDSSDV